MWLVLCLCNRGQWGFQTDVIWFREKCDLEVPRNMTFLLPQMPQVDLYLLQPFDQVSSQVEWFLVARPLLTLASSPSVAGPTLPVPASLLRELSWGPRMPSFSRLLPGMCILRHRRNPCVCLHSSQSCPIQQVLHSAGCPLCESLDWDAPSGTWLTPAPDSRSQATWEGMSFQMVPSPSRVPRLMG